MSARPTTAIPRADTWVRPYRLRATVQEEYVKTFSYLVVASDHWGIIRKKRSRILKIFLVLEVSREKKERMRISRAAVSFVSNFLTGSLCALPGRGVTLSSLRVREIVKS